MKFLAQTSSPSVHPLVAVGVIAFFGGLLGLKFWCDHKELTLDRLWSIKLSPHNEVVVQLGERLIFSSPSGNHLRTLESADFGIDELNGDFAFFANGDLLLAQQETGSDKRKILDILAREAAPEQQQGARLQRCSVQARTCIEFSSALPDFPRTFKLFIDPADEHVYIADTSRHQLWLLDAQGQVLAKKSGFKFPNQLLVRDKMLWLADTNHHQIIQLRSEQEYFAEAIARHQVAQNPPHRWPFALAAVNDRWLVLLGNNQMTDARALIYSADWATVDTLELPPDADPVALLAVDERVLMTDNRHFRIYQFTNDGEMLPDFTIHGIQQELTALQQEAAQWRWSSRITLGAGVVSFIIGFAFALRQHFADNPPAKNHSRVIDGRVVGGGVIEDVPAELVNGIWLSPSRHFRFMPYFMAFGSFAFFGLLFLSPPTLSSTDESSAAAALMYLIPFSLLIMCLPLWRLSRLRLGLFGHHLEVISHNGARLQVPYKDVLWNRRALVAKTQVIPIGNTGQAAVFPQETIKKYLAPRLQTKNKIGELAMMRYQWHSEEGLQKYTVIMFVLIAIIAFVLALDIWL